MGQHISEERFAPMAAKFSAPDPQAEVAPSRSKTNGQIGPESFRCKELSTEVLEFCKRHGILPLLEKAVLLAARHFAPTGLSVYLSGDPDGSDEWIVVLSSVSGSVESVLRAYRGLKAEWLQQVNWERSALIRFLYDIN